MPRARSDKVVSCSALRHKQKQLFPKALKVYEVSPVQTMKTTLHRASRHVRLAYNVVKAFPGWRRLRSVRVNTGGLHLVNTRWESNLGSVILKAAHSEGFTDAYCHPKSTPIPKPCMGVHRHRRPNRVQGRPGAVQ